jgi:hypothetical protein
MRKLVHREKISKEENINKESCHAQKWSETYKIEKEVYKNEQAQRKCFCKKT